MLSIFRSIFLRYQRNSIKTLIFGHLRPNTIFNLLPDFTTFHVWPLGDMEFKAVIVRQMTDASIWEFRKPMSSITSNLELVKTNCSICWDFQLANDSIRQLLFQGLGIQPFGLGIQRKQKIESGALKYHSFKRIRSRCTNVPTNAQCSINAQFEVSSDRVNHRPFGTQLVTVKTVATKI